MWMYLSCFRGAGLFAAVSVCLLSACSIGFDLGREQCESDSDCSAFDSAKCENKICVAANSGGGSTGGGGSAPVDPAWGCLDGFVAPTPGATVTYHFRFELATVPNVPPLNLAVELCAVLDVDCLNPVPNTPQPDPDGNLYLEVASSFQGYLKVTATDLVATEAYLPRLVVLPPKEQVIRVVREAEFTALVAAAGETRDPTKGIALVLTSNCEDLRTSGVKVSSQDLDMDTVSFYFSGNLPDINATETDAQGAAGFLNLPLGIITVATQRASNDDFIGSTSFRAKPDTISYVPLGPTPSN